MDRSQFQWHGQSLTLKHGFKVSSPLLVSPRFSGNRSYELRRLLNQKLSKFGDSLAKKGANWATLKYNFV